MDTRPITDQTQDQLAALRWQLDPRTSSAESRVPHFWGLVTVKGHFERLDGCLEVDSCSDFADSRIRVDGELEAAGERLAMTLEPTIHQTDDQLEIDVTTTVDQRQLGMTWSPLAMTKSPVTLTVHASLRRQS